MDGPFFLTWDHLRGSVICFGCGKYPLSPFTPQPKVVRLVVVVVVAFFICWSPHQLLMARAIFATDHRVIRNDNAEIDVDYIVFDAGVCL